MDNLIQFILHEVPDCPVEIIKTRIKTTLLEFSRERLFTWEQIVSVKGADNSFPVEHPSGFNQLKIKSSDFYLSDGQIKSRGVLLEGEYSVQISGLLEDVSVLPSSFLDGSIEMIGYEVLAKLFAMPHRSWSSQGASESHMALALRSRNSITSAEYKDDDYLDRASMVAAFNGGFSSSRRGYE